jgi:hypothetical protein
MSLWAGRLKRNNAQFQWLRRRYFRSVLDVSLNRLEAVACKD